MLQRIIALAWVTVIGLEISSAAGDCDWLRKIEADRAKWRNGRLEFSSWFPGAPGSVPMYYAALHSERDVVFSCYGDEHGALSPGSTGIMADSAFGPHQTLVRDGEWWRYLAGSTNAELDEWNVRPGTFDARTLGLSATPPTGSLEHTLWGSDSSKWTCEERKEGRYVVIVARSGGYRREWTIDPDEGSLPVRVRTFDGDVCTADSRISLQYDGERWYPAEVEYFRGDSDSGVPVYQRIEVSGVETNVSDLPQTGFVPADIGIDAGVTITHRTAEMKASIRIWTGDQAISPEEHSALPPSQQRPGPLHLSNLERARALRALREVASESDPTKTERGLALVKARESEWEKYTREFIQRYRLDGDQTQKSILHLDAAKSDAQQFAVQHRATLDALAKETDEMATLKDPERTERLKFWNAKRLKALEPMDRIFTKKLLPDLDRVPTRQQRHQYGVQSRSPKPTTSQPTESSPTNSLSRP